MHPRAKARASGGPALGNQRDKKQVLRSLRSHQDDNEGKSDFVVRDPRRFSTILTRINLEIGKKSRRLLLEHSQDRHRHSPNLQLRALAAPQLEHRSPGARVRRDDDFRLGRIGKHRSRRLARHLPAMNLVRDPAVALHQLRDEIHVHRLRLLDLRPPHSLERVVARRPPAESRSSPATRPHTAARAANTQNQRDGEPTRG